MDRITEAIKRDLEYLGAGHVVIYQMFDIRYYKLGQQSLCRGNWG